MHRLPWIAGAMVMALCCVCPASAGNSAVKLSPQQAADLAAMRRFILTDALVDKYIAVQQDLAFPLEQVLEQVTDDSEEDDEEDEKDCEPDAFTVDLSRSITDLATALDSRPGVHAGLARHAIGSREYLLVMDALVTAEMIELKNEQPELFTGDCPNLVRVEDAINPASLD